MQDSIIKQEKLVHNLFLRHIYDKSNSKKLADYTKAKSDLISLKYSEAK